MRTIAIDLSPQSCDRAVRELSMYGKSARSKYDEVCRRLAEIGVREVEQILNQVNIKEHNFADVGMERTDNGYKIVMYGEDVYFIEFGTGSDTEAHYPVSVPVFPGSWSMEHSQKYAKQGWWWYGGEVFTGTLPYKPMYYAEKKMREEMPRIVKEVFGE